MPDVFIGNATKQVYEFSYWIAERKAPITQRVPILGQVRLAAQLTPDEVTNLKLVNAKYGLTEVDRLGNAPENFSGYLISDKPIRPDVIKRAAHMRDMVLANQGKRMRAEAAIAMVNTIEAETSTPADNYEISVAEIEPDRGFSNPEDDHTAEGWRIDRHAPPGAPPPTRRKGRRLADFAKL